MSSTIANTHFCSQDFESWRDSINIVFDVERPPEQNAIPFNAFLTAFQVGDMVVGDASLDAQRYRRSPARTRRDGMDHFVLNLYRTGGWKAETSSGSFEGRSGQVSVLDLSRELISDEPQSDLVALFVPRSLIEDQLPNLGALHGSGPTGPHGVLLGEYMDLLARRLPDLPAGQEAALATATCQMITACIAPSLDNIEAARPGLEMVLLRRAKRYIEAQLGSHALTIDAICNIVGMSRRTLYRLFEHEGGVLRYIQNRRLERIRAILCDPSETRRISDVAADFGFVRNDHFARAFKYKFGDTARDVRGLVFRQMAEPVPSAMSQTGGQGFDDWIRNLSA